VSQRALDERSTMPPRRTACGHQGKMPRGRRDVRAHSDPISRRDSSTILASKDAMTTIKENLQKELNALLKLRDELKVQAHLGKLEAKDALLRIENEIPVLEKTMDESIDKASSAIREAMKDAQKALDRLRAH
jgi:hypothetical protein